MICNVYVIQLPARKEGEKNTKTQIIKTKEISKASERTFYQTHGYGPREWKPHCCEKPANVTPEERVPGFVDDATQLRGSLWNPEPLVNRRSLTETLRKLDPCHLQGISHCRLWCLVVFVSTKQMYLQTENNRTHSLASHLPVPPSGYHVLLEAHPSVVLSVWDLQSQLTETLSDNTTYSFIFL